MKRVKISLFELRWIVGVFFLLATLNSYAQSTDKKVVITGVRFAYPLVQQWIDSYKRVNPDAQIVIETRTVTDPEKYDLLIEAYEHDKSFKDTRNYYSLGRYALITIANSKSGVYKELENKGFSEKLIKQVFFHDVYAEKEKPLKSNYTIYTRLQKAGAPITFASYFGFEQQNIKGKAIAGADEHLIKALQKDTTALSYSTLGLVFDPKTRQVVDGISVVPVDLDGNGKVGKDERIYESLDKVIEVLEAGKVKNVPMGDLHISIGKNASNAEAEKFLQWVVANGQNDLHQFGFLHPDTKQLASQRQKLGLK
jgi:phosphate transport system substrate-binding protein